MGISIVWYAVPEGIAVGAVRVYPLQHFAIFVLLLVTSAAFVSLVFLFLLTVFAAFQCPRYPTVPYFVIVFCDFDSFL